MKKSLGFYDNLSRLAPQSHFRSSVTYTPLSAYAPSNILAWAKNVGHYWFTRKYPFPTSWPQTIMTPDKMRIAIAGDWGSGTEEAEKVAAQMTASSPDYTIHLGDVYYVGSESEVDENFLGIKHSGYEPLRWPWGKYGTFSLCGNHDMYSNGRAYFNVLLPNLHQPVSFFRLENNNWIILGLDTGYNSTGMDWGPFRPNCAQPKVVMDWLAAQRFPDNKRVLVLTHHQPWSAFEESYPATAKQLSTVLHKPFTWIWGHEHRMASYEKFSAYGITATGFCVGHGGMPVKVQNPKTLTPRVAFTDKRLYANHEGLKVGYNGHAQLDFDGNGLVLTFVDLNGSVVIRIFI